MNPVGDIWSLHPSFSFSIGMGRAHGKTKTTAGGFKTMSVTWQMRPLISKSLITAEWKPHQLASILTGASAADSLPGEKVSANIWVPLRKELEFLWHGMYHFCLQFANMSNPFPATKLQKKLRVNSSQVKGWNKIMFLTLGSQPIVDK